MDSLEDLLNTLGEVKRNVVVNGKAVDFLLKVKDRKVFITQDKKVFNSLKNKVKIIGISPSVTRVLKMEDLQRLLEIDENVYLTKKNFHKHLNLPLKIAKFLEENPGSHIRAIARELNIHPQSVKRWLDRGPELLEIKRIESDELPNLPVMFKLKDGITPEEFSKIVKNRKVEKRKNVGEKRKKDADKRKRTKIRDKDRQIALIAKFLEENPGSHIRAIARNLGLSPSVVYRRLKEIENFIIVSPVAEELSKEDLSLPNLPMLIRLKDGVTSEGILRYLKFKRIIGKK